MDTKKTINQQNVMSGKFNNKRSRLFSALVVAHSAMLGGLGVSVAHAQQSMSPLEEVVVTARRKEENLQDVPIAITAFSDNFLRENNITQLDDLRTHVPSMNISVGGSSTNTPLISIRGQRPSEVLITLDPAVPMYFADVVLTPTQGTNLSMYDLQNVQVLKGPQGTLFGRNSTGGAVLFTPKTPGDEFGGYLEAKGGDYDAMGLEGAVDVPATEQLRFRLAGKYFKRDGYQDNVADNALRGKEKYWDEDSKAVRLSMQWEPSDTFDNLLVFDWSKNDMQARIPTPVAFNPSVEPYGCTLCGLTNTFFNSGANAGLVDAAVARQQGRDWDEIETDYDAEESVENTFVSNITTWDFSDNVRFKNIFGYRKLEFADHKDTDGTALPMFGNPTAGDANSVNVITPSSFPQGTVDTDQYSNEFQVFFNALDDRLETLVGLYYFNMDGTQTSPTQLLPIVPQNSPNGDAENTSYAIFGEANYALSDEWSFTLGLRQTWDKREATFKNTRRDVCLVEDPSNPPAKLPDDQCADDVDEDFDKATGRFVVSWTPRIDMLLYGSVSTGYRSGGYNLRAEIQEQKEPFDEETVTTYEIGHKMDWEVGNLPLVRTNIAIYWQDYSDIQKTQAISTGGFGTATVNAAEATIKGGELDITVVPTTGLEFTVAYAYVDASYDEWDQFDALAGGIVDVSDRPFTWIPEHSGTASVRYQLPFDDSIGEVSLGGSYYYQSKVNVTDNPTSFNIEGIDNGPLNASTEVDSYGVWDARLDWEGVMQSNFDLAAWVKNGGDEEYAVGGLNVLTSLGWAAHVYGAPRTIGASLRYRF